MKKLVVFRISTVSHSLSVLLKNQFSYLGKKGYNYFLLCYPDEFVKKQADLEDARYLPVYLSRKLRPLSDLQELFRIFFYIIKYRPEIVHTHSPKAGLIGMIAAKFSRVKAKIHTVAGMPLVEKSGYYRQFLVMMEKLTYRCADAVIFNSPSQAQYAIDNEWIKGSKVVVIGSGSSNGIDTSYFDRSRVNDKDLRDIKSLLDLNDDNIILTFVGRIAKSKGVDELIDSFIILKQKHPFIKLILVGMKDLTDPINEITWSEINSNRDIHWFGHQEDVRPFYHIADIFVFPSYREGFPQVIMQACSMSCAIIATDINGANEIIKHNENGILIKPKSVDSIVVACDKLLRDPRSRERLAAKSRSNIVKGFDQIDFWNSLDNLYRTILDSSNDNRK